MNSREKFLSVVNFEKAAEVPNWEFGYWYDAILRWYDEGLPRINAPTQIEFSQWIHGDADPGLDVFTESPKYYGSDISEFFGFDKRVHAAPLYAPPLPYFEREVYEEDEENIHSICRSFGRTLVCRRWLCPASSKNGPRQGSHAEISLANSLCPQSPPGRIECDG